jgi:phosphoenolpyruvate carboxykinase (ATP)
MLGEKLDRHGTKVYLVNTGWSGGPYGVGKRIDITVTRRMVQAALEGELERASSREDPFFRVLVPERVEGVPAEILSPKETWTDKKAYDERARKLACEFGAHFEKAYGKKGIAAAVAAQCPGN